MTKKSRFVSAAIALAALAGVSLATAPANAAVVVRHVAYVNPAAPVAVNHYGYTRVTHVAPPFSKRQRTKLCADLSAVAIFATAFGVLVADLFPSPLVGEGGAHNVRAG